LKKNTTLTMMRGTKPDITTGLILHLMFDEGADVILVDTSGNNNTGTITIGAGGTQTQVGTFVDGDTTSAWYNGRTGISGTSLNFDGTDDFVTIADSASLDVTTGLTISVFFKKPTNGRYERMVEKLSTASNSPLWGMQLTDTGKLQFFIGNAGSSTNYYINSNTAITDSNWHQYTATYRADNSLAYLYIDGALDKLGQVVFVAGGGGAWSGNVETSTGNLLIGKMIYSGASSYLKGQLDELKIFNRALKSPDVYTNYARTINI